MMVVGMADTVMVSIAGEAAISGVSIVNDVNNLIIQLLAALPAAVLSLSHSIWDGR
jgi:Na+-driven multidrug efflux pump